MVNEMTIYGIYARKSGLYITALSANSSTEATTKFQKEQHNLPGPMKAAKVVAREMQIPKPA